MKKYCLYNNTKDETLRLTSPWNYTFCFICIGYVQKGSKRNIGFIDWFSFYLPFPFLWFCCISGER